MIAVALTWLFLNGSEIGKGTTHPAAILRFREAAAQFKAGERSVGLENASYLLKLFLIQRHSRQYMKRLWKRLSGFQGVWKIYSPVDARHPGEHPSVWRFLLNL